MFKTSRRKHETNLHAVENAKRKLARFTLLCFLVLSRAPARATCASSFLFLCGSSSAVYGLCN